MGIADIMQPRAVHAPRSTDVAVRPPSHEPSVDTSNGADSAPMVAPSLRKPRKSKPKPITDKKLRKYVGLIVTLKIQGKSRKEIAEELELSENTVKSYMYRGRQRGYIDSSSFDDPNDVLDTIIKPKVVANIEKLLDWRHPKTQLPSMDMTIETAKGIGVFQQHSSVKGGAVAATGAFALKVQVVMPPQISAAGIPAPEARTGTMGGRGAVEGEVIEASED